MAPELPALLSCGHPTDALVTSVADDTNPPLNAGRCPVCQAALAQLRQAWSPVRRVAGMSFAPPPYLHHRVRQRIRRLATSPMVILDASHRGTTSVSEAMLGQLAEHRAGEVAGVTEVWGASVEHSPHEGLRADLDVSLGWTDDLRAVAASVRRAVTEELQRLIRAPVAVDVTVVDVVPLAAERGRR